MMPSLPRVKTHYILQESEITIITESEKYVKIALDCLKQKRAHLEDIITVYPEFKSTFSPYFTDDRSDVIMRMQDAAKIADVGPMASVAGVLADLMCEKMVEKGAQIAVVENGGEIMIHSTEDIYIGLYSQTTRLQGSMGFRFRGENGSLGVATSSGTFGHAKSLGDADTVTVFAPTAGIADAVATSITNSIKREGSKCLIKPAITFAESLDCIYGIFITCGDLVAKTGTIPEIVFSQ